MKLALLVPMRGQPIRRELWLYTLQRTLGSTPVQVIIRVDDDDPDTRAWVRDNLDAQVIVGPRYDGYRSLPRFFNEMVRSVDPDVTAIMCGNDDCRYETPDWAGHLCRASRRYPRGLFNLGVMTYPGGAFPFSTVSPNMVEALGYLNREDLLYQDIFLRDVHARLGCCELVPAVTILHIGQASDDAQAAKAAIPADYWAHHVRVVTEVTETLRPLMTRRSVGWRQAVRAWM